MRHIGGSNMKCENCKKEHDGTYGSGRFCSSKCARGFSTKEKRKEINDKVSEKLKGIKLKNPHILTNTERYSGVLKSLEVNKKIREEKILNNSFDSLSKKEKRERIRIEQKDKCLECGLKPLWNNKPLSFHLDHIDGNNQNNSRENLRLICPNCHSQTETYCAMKNHTYNRVSEDIFVKALKDSSTIRQCLIKIKLTPRGANYTRARKLIEKYKIKMLS